MLPSLKVQSTKLRSRICRPSRSWKWSMDHLIMPVHQVMDLKPQKLLTRIWQAIEWLKLEDPLNRLMLLNPSTTRVKRGVAEWRLASRRMLKSIWLGKDQHPTRPILKRVTSRSSSRLSLLQRLSHRSLLLIKYRFMTSRKTSQTGCWKGLPMKLLRAASSITMSLHRRLSSWIQAILSSSTPIGLLRSVKSKRCGPWERHSIHLEVCNRHNNRTLATYSVKATGAKTALWSCRKVSQLPLRIELLSLATVVGHPTVHVDIRASTSIPPSSIRNVSKLHHPTE